MDTAGLEHAIRSAEPAEFWFWSLLGIGLAIAAFVLAFRWLRFCRIIEDTPTSRIRSAHQGFVELRGRQELAAGEPIVAPLSGRTCTWWRFKIERRVRTRNGSRWRQVEAEVSHSFFKLIDDTGECIVDPEGAVVTADSSDTWYGSTPRPGGGPDGSLSLGGSYRYSEQRMHPGETVYALGEFTTRRASFDYDTQQDLALRLAEWKADRDALVARYDTDGDGEISLEEWERVRADALTEIRQRQLDQMADSGLDVIGCPTDGRPFLLSVHPQEPLARRYRFMALGGFIGFLVTTGASGFAVLTRLGGG